MQQCFNISLKMEEHILELLQKTGWGVDDLIAKINSQKDKLTTELASRTSGSRTATSSSPSTFADTVSSSSSVNLSISDSKLDTKHDADFDTVDIKPNLSELEFYEELHLTGGGSINSEITIENNEPLITQIKQEDIIISEAEQYFDHSELVYYEDITTKVESDEEYDVPLEVPLETHYVTPKKSSNNSTNDVDDFCRSGEAFFDRSEHNYNKLPNNLENSDGASSSRAHASSTYEMKMADSSNASDTFTCTATSEIDRIVKEVDDQTRTKESDSDTTLKPDDWISKELSYILKNKIETDLHQSAKSITTEPKSNQSENPISSCDKEISPQQAVEGIKSVAPEPTAIFSKTFSQQISPPLTAIPVIQKSNTTNPKIMFITRLDLAKHQALKQSVVGTTSNRSLLTPKAPSNMKGLTKITASDISKFKIEPVKSPRVKIQCIAPPLKKETPKDEERYLSVKDFKQLSDKPINLDTPNEDSEKSSKDVDLSDDLIMDLPEEIEAEVPKESLDVDSIRDNIRVQLTSLRKRKTSPILDDLNTKSLDEAKKAKLDEKLYTQTNENIGFKISDVQGGVALTDPPIKASEKKDSLITPKRLQTKAKILNYDKSQSIRTVKLKTNQLTVLDPKTPFVQELLNKTAKAMPVPAKVPVKPMVYKQENRFFVLNKNSALNKSGKKPARKLRPLLPKTPIEVEPKEEILVPSDTSSNEVSLNEASTSSAFLSNVLDEFLTENAKLNDVSYDVPQEEEGLRKSPVIAPPEIEDEELPKVLSRIKAKTVARKRQILEETKEERNVVEMSARLDEPVRSNKTFRRKNKKSYVMYNGKKIYVRSFSLDKCVAKIRDDHLKNAKARRQRMPRQKPTLLSALKEGGSEGVTYRPGPLCDKTLLQSDNFYWETQVKNLPKIYLDIESELGKPIPPDLLHLLPKNEGKISRSQIEFALSSLPNTEGKIYRFPIKYRNNAQKIKVRKAKSHSLPAKATENPQEEISALLNDLIKYVGVKEISDTLIKEDEERVAGPEVVKKSTLPKKRRRTRTQVELSRLNCTIINMSLDQPKAEKLDCNKQQCKLGCVCESLDCTPILADHCNKIDCMFECSCPTKPQLSPETLSVSVLNNSSLNGLEDKLTQDLAREEKAFAQTVIQTDDKTIFLPKRRRSAKAPNKFGEYVVDPIVKFPSEIPALKADVCNMGLVELANYDLESLVLFCMVHGVYNCSSCCVMVPRKHKDEEPIELPIKRIKVEKNSDDEKDGIVLLKRVEMLTNSKRQYAAKRTRPKPRRKTTQTPKEVPPVPKVEEERVYPPNDEFLETCGSPCSEPSEPSSSSSHKRKQSFEVRKDCELSLDRIVERSIQSQHPRRRNIVANSVEVLGTHFEGEVIIDRPETLKQLGVKAVNAGYARFVPFTSVVHHYKEKLIKLWFMVDSPHRILVTRSGSSAPMSCDSVSSTYNSNAICGWILQNRLPDKYDSAKLFLILISNRGAYEICGMSQHTFDRVQFKNMQTVEYRDKDEKMKIMTLEKTNYPRVKLHIVENGKTNKFIMMALPYGPENRWKMLQFNAPFEYINFPDLNYSIQYKYLVAIKKMTNKNDTKQTIILRAQALSHAYDHPDFGIHFPPYKKNFIFIGPYRGRKMNVTFDSPTSRSVFWDLIQLPMAIYNSNPPSTSAQEKSSLLKYQESLAVKRSELTKATRKDPEEKFLVLDCEPKQPQDFNLFFVTNVPRFGFLGAITYPGMLQVDISWPFENKILRFRNLTLARHFLQDRFRALVQPIPLDFQIFVYWQSKLDLCVHKPINPEIFNGYFVCGKFGIYNINEIATDRAKDIIGITKEELKVIFIGRAAAFLKKRVVEFAKMIRLRTRMNLTDLRVDTILELAVNEIATLEELNETKCGAVQALKAKRERLTMRANSLAKDSLEDQLIIKEILKSKDCETIEILDDSDDEPTKSEQSSENVPPPKAVVPKEIDQLVAAVGKLNRNKELEMTFVPCIKSQTSLLKSAHPVVAKITINDDDPDPGPSTSSAQPIFIPKLSSNTILRKIGMPSTSSASAATEKSPALCINKRITMASLAQASISMKKVRLVEVKDGKIVKSA